MIPEVLFEFATLQKHEISQKIRQTEQSQKKKVGEKLKNRCEHKPFRMMRGNVAPDPVRFLWADISSPLMGRGRVRGAPINPLEPAFGDWSGSSGRPAQLLGMVPA